MPVNAHSSGRPGDRPSVFPRPVLPMGYPVLGRCVLERFVRHGPFASVYLARETLSTGAHFGVRMINPELTRRREYSPTVFVEEIERLKTIDHRAIPGVVAYDPGPLEPVVLTRHEGGTTLRRLLADKRQPTGAELGRVVTEIAAALDALHHATPSVLHRALCPENIRVAGPGGSVWLEESGLVHVLMAAGMVPHDARDFTLPGYAPPEGLVRDASPKMDAFTLAIIAFECLTGRLPFDSHAPGAEGEETTTAPVYADLPPEVEAVFTRVWSVPEREAYATPMAFATDFAAALAEPAPAPAVAKRTLQGMAPIAVPASVPTMRPPLALEPRRPDNDVALFDPPAMLDRAEPVHEPPAASRENTQELSVTDLMPLESDAAPGAKAPPSAPPPLPPGEGADDPGAHHAHAPPPVPPEAKHHHVQPHDHAPHDEPRRPSHDSLRTQAIEDSWASPPPDHDPGATFASPSPGHARHADLPPSMPDVNAVSLPPAIPAPPPVPRSVAPSSVRPATLAPPPTSLVAQVARVLVPSTVIAAVIATGGLIYAARSLERWATLAREPHPPIAPVVAPPVVAPPVVTPPVVAPPVVTPPVVAQQPPVTPTPPVVAPVTPPPAPTPVTPTPVTPTPTPVATPATDAGAPSDEGTHPSEADRRRIATQLRPLVLNCVEGIEEPSTISFVVRYEGSSGRAAGVRLRGVFAEPPVSPCVEDAVRTFRAPPFTAESWTTRYSFPIPPPRWRQQAGGGTE